MARAHSLYICQQCNYSQVGWAGKCPNCGAWGSLVETYTKDGKKEDGSKKNLKYSKSPVLLSSVKSSEGKRIKTKIAELDRVLGGGLVLGQLVLLAGEPGIGKSTLLTQLADTFENCLYVAGEESANQIKIRAERLKLKNKSIHILESMDVDEVVTVSENFGKNKFSLVIVDSVQTLVTSDLSGMAGSVGQIKEVTSRLMKFAKSNGVPTILVGHVTKEGSVAGPAVLAHLVDTVLWFEGDKNSSLRLLRTFKNRFGPTDEVGIFEMKDTGLISPKDTQGLFLSNIKTPVSGSVVTSVVEGTRPVLVEIQSLVVPTKLPIPRRVAQGIDAKRVELILAVLTRRCGLPLYESDVFVNVVGGISVREPASDLAVAISIASSFYDRPLSREIIAMGEVGLLGEIREVRSQTKRIDEAKRQGYNFVVSSKDFSFVKQVLTSKVFKK